MVLPLLTAALIRRLPGMLMGSGATERLCTTTGSLLSPQFSQAKPPTYSTKGQEELEPCLVFAGGLSRAAPLTPAKHLLTKSQKTTFSPFKCQFLNSQLSKTEDIAETLCLCASACTLYPKSITRLQFPNLPQFCLQTLHM